LFLLAFLTALDGGGMILRFSPDARRSRLSDAPVMRQAATGQAAIMSRGKGSPGRFDAPRLARERGVVEGTLDAHALPRVADLLSEGPASVAWRIQGSTDPSGRPALDIELRGSVTLVCQRCLGDLEWLIAQASEVLLARDESELAALDADSSLEVVLAQGPTDPLLLVEDELVLALPFAPRHPEDQCDSTMTTRRT
jgi:uncharacterized protein